MKFLAIENELMTVDWTTKQSLLKEEAQKVLQLYLSGIIREVYFNDLHDAVLILECENRDRALEALASLPLVQEGLITFQLTMLQPYTGWNRLIETSS